MVSPRRYAGRWHAYAAFGMALILGQPALAQSPHHGASGPHASQVADQARANATQPTGNAAAGTIERDTQRIVRALESENAYSRSPRANKKHTRPLTSRGMAPIGPGG